MVVVVELVLYVIVALVAFAVGLRARRTEHARSRLLHPVSHAAIVEPTSHVEQVRRVQLFDFERDA